MTQREKDEQLLFNPLSGTEADRATIDAKFAELRIFFTKKIDELKQHYHQLDAQENQFAALQEEIQRML
ncbi:MAG: hypothetical protein WBM00_01160, partial [Solirubrobacterales bacterium]